MHLEFRLYFHYFLYSLVTESEEIIHLLSITNVDINVLDMFLNTTIIVPHLYTYLVGRDWTWATRIAWSFC